MLPAGKMVITKLVEVPMQDAPPPLYKGVMLMVEVMSVIPGFAAMKAAMFPVPLAANPMAVLELVQEKTVPEIFPVKAI